MNENQIEELNKNLAELNTQIARQVSIKFIVLKGIVYGVASVVGATIVAGIVFMFLDRAIDSAEDVPIIDTVVEDINLERQRPE